MGSRWVEAGDPAEPPTVPGAAPTARGCPVQTSLVSRLQISGEKMKSFKGLCGKPKSLVLVSSLCFVFWGPG